MEITKKWKEFVDKMNSNGIPVPTARDPKTKQGSVTLSLVVVSAGLCCVSVLIMLGTCVARLKSDFVLTPETSTQIHDAFVSSLEFLGLSLSAYLGRKLQKDPNGAMTIDGAKQELEDLRK